MSALRRSALRNLHMGVSIAGPQRLSPSLRALDAFVLLLATVGLIIPPLTMFHVIQLVVCAMIASRLWKPAAVSYG